MRKTIFIALICAIIAFPALAEERTLIGSGFKNGGFGAVTAKLTTLNGNFVAMSGARGGWVIDNKFVLGFGSYDLWDLQNANSIPGYDEGMKIDFQYSGFEFEYIHHSEALYHLAVKLLTGWGEAKLIDPRNRTNRTLIDDGLFVLELTAAGELNITKWMRSYIGAGYRRCFDVDLETYDDNDFSGPSLDFGLKFGSNM